MSGIKISVAAPVSSMRNLEQIRAKNALGAVKYIGTGSDGGKAVAKKVPAQIIQNGFLGALAFAIESVADEKKFSKGLDGWFYYLKARTNNDKHEGCGYANTFTAFLKHLKPVGLNHDLPCDDLQKFLDALCAKDADVLRAVTAEALAYLNYLRRFAKPGKEDGAEEEEG